MPKRIVDGMLHVLGAEVGIPALCLDEAGCCSLAIDEIVVNFEVDEASGELFLYADLGAAPTMGESALYQELLGANLAWQGTGGATLSLDRPGQRIVLMRSLPVRHIQDADFKAVVEAFVNTAEGWTKRIAEASAERPERTEEPPFMIRPDILA